MLYKCKKRRKIVLVFLVTKAPGGWMKWVCLKCRKTEVFSIGEAGLSMAVWLIAVNQRRLHLRLQKKSRSNEWQPTMGYGSTQKTIVALSFNHSQWEQSKVLPSASLRNRKGCYNELAMNHAKIWKPFKYLIDMFNGTKLSNFKFWTIVLQTIKPVHLVMVLMWWIRGEVSGCSCPVLFWG